MGNRIAKIVTVSSGDITKTFYILDAQGNCMSIYTYTSSDNVLVLTERNIYGSSRLGLEQVGQEMMYQDIELYEHIIDLSDLYLASGPTSCTDIGWSFADYPIISTPQFGDFDSDGDVDLKISHATNIDYSARFMFNTIPGENYNVSYTIDELGLFSHGVIVDYCSSSPSALNETVLYLADDVSLSFTATADVTQIKWYNYGVSVPAQTIISNLVITGPGNVLGTGNNSNTPSEYLISNYKGDKRYELSNHLGNVLTVVTDRKLPQENPANLGTVEYYTADVVAFNDYYPFGMLMPGRNSGEVFRYGFNGMESDDEVKENKGSSYDFGARMYDPRVGRWFSTDAKAHKYPGLSPYNMVGNSPLMHKEVDGKDYIVVIDKINKTITIKATYYVEIGDKLSKNEALKGVDFWNKLSGKFETSIKEKIDGKTKKIDYQINFDLIVEETFNAKDCARELEIVPVEIDGEIHTSVSHKIDGTNSFIALSEEKYSKKRAEHSATTALAFVSGGFELFMDISKSKENVLAVPHELGHTLGLDHWKSTLMNNGYDNGFDHINSKVTASMIQTILGRAGLFKKYEVEGAAGGRGKVENTEGEEVSGDAKVELKKNTTYVKKSN